MPPAATAERSRWGFALLLLAVLIAGGVLTYGKTFAVTATAGPEFLTLHPLWLAWLTALTGLCLTAALANGLSLTLHRREKLERLVLQRSSELLHSEARFAQLAQALGSQLQIAGTLNGAAGQTD